MSYRYSGTTTVVRVSPGQQLGETMIRLRTWLDREKIQPAEFKTAVDGKGYKFTIGFLNTNDVERFRAQFGAP
jgi:outer membrane lipoprotein-sorting protein